MFYLFIYIFFYPILKILRAFRKNNKRNLIIQTAKIGDYVNSTIIFDLALEFDIVLDRINCEFADYDSRVGEKFKVQDFKKNIFTKLNLALILFKKNYQNVYILTPNSLNLFLAKMSFAKNYFTISHQFCGINHKILSHKMTKISHSTDKLTLSTYLELFGKFENFQENSTNLTYKKLPQKPIFIPQNCIITSPKFKVGISLTAGNKMKTPPLQTWDKIFKILSNFDLEVYIFGVGNDANLLKNIATYGVKIINLVDKISIKELPFYTSKMQLYISSDTGNYYIADSVNVPTICLMGPCFASEQRGVFNSLILCQNLKPISSVFNSIYNIDASDFFELNQDEEQKILDFISDLYLNFTQKA